MNSRRFIAIVIIFTFVLVFPSSKTVEAAYSNGYNYRGTITVDNAKVSGSSNLTDFSMLVSITNASLMTTGNGGHVTDAEGDDIIFTTTSDVQLDHEVELYVPSTGQLVAWVRIPTLSYNADTEIYIYYGNSSVTTSQENVTGVWGSEYQAMWHMSEDPSGTAPQILDSADNANNKDLTSSGTMTSDDLVSGKIGYALDLDGTDDALDGDDTGFPTGGSARSFSAWVRPETVDYY